MATHLAIEQPGGVETTTTYGGRLTARQAATVRRRPDRPCPRGPGDVVAFQRTNGNQTICRLLAVASAIRKMIDPPS
jgi:hypothetical protein